MRAHRLARSAGDQASSRATTGGTRPPSCLASSGSRPALAQAMRHRPDGPPSTPAWLARLAHRCWVACKHKGWHNWTVSMHERGPVSAASRRATWPWGTSPAWRLNRETGEGSDAGGEKAVGKEHACSAGWQEAVLRACGGTPRWDRQSLTAASRRRAAADKPLQPHIVAPRLTAVPSHLPQMLRPTGAQRPALGAASCSARRAALPPPSGHIPASACSRCAHFNGTV